MCRTNSYSSWSTAVNSNLKRSPIIRIFDVCLKTYSIQWATNKTTFTTGRHFCESKRTKWERGPVQLWGQAMLNNRWMRLATLSMVLRTTTKPGEQGSLMEATMACSNAWLVSFRILMPIKLAYKSLFLRGINRILRICRIINKSYSTRCIIIIRAVLLDPFNNSRPKPSWANCLSNHSKLAWPVVSESLEKGLSLPDCRSTISITTVVCSVLKTVASSKWFRKWFQHRSVLWAALMQPTI